MFVMVTWFPELDVGAVVDVPVLVPELMPLSGIGGIDGTWAAAVRAMSATSISHTAARRNNRLLHTLPNSFRDSLTMAQFDLQPESSKQSLNLAHLELSTQPTISLHEISGNMKRSLGGKRICNLRLYVT